ncbi:hypothetical protein Dsin_021963 [Dipteronia sinensis]|uniref:Uncharacterized protein n=1 Tax=Dipteronia sinensis TaxID=43782 RepID=A0AAE0DZB0_9ROSI|nr:hypothetical protein Dsin_021963 [Dipteronia sinensis]
MPLSWITNYEKAFQNTVPVIASDTSYTRQHDGSITTVCKPLTNVPASHSEVTPSASPDPPIFQSLMIKLITSEEDIPIHSFDADGSAIYTNKINGHFIWDVDPSMCDVDCDCRRSSRKLCASCKIDRRSHSLEDPGSPWIGLLPQMSSQPIHCFMAFSYDQDFPPLEPTSNPEKNRFSRAYVQSTEVLPDGSLKHPFQAEQVLNWKSHNAKVQNRVLSSIDQKIDRVSHHVSQHENRLHSMDSTFKEMFSDLQSRIAKLDADLHYLSILATMALSLIRKRERLDNSELSWNKWKEIRLILSFLLISPICLHHIP